VKLTYSLFSDKGPIRTVNADSVLADADLGFFAVADGVGSTESSILASEYAVACAYERFREVGSDANLDLSGLAKAIENDYESKFRSLGRRPSTTLTIGIFRDGHLHYFNIGDSPAFLLTNQTQLLTTQHTVIDRMQRFTDFSAMKSIEGSHILFNYLGSFDVQPTLYPPLRLPEKCRLLFCTDGLIEIIDQNDLQGVHLRNDTAESFVSELRQRASSCTPPDNFSMIVVDLNQ
jgi:protein phosphatase